MTQTVTSSSFDAGRTGPNSAHPNSRPAILRFVERFKRASGTSPSATTPADSSRPGPDIGGSLGPVELEQLCEARRRATEMYPGPVGDLVARDLDAVAEFGFRFARGTLYRRLVDHLLDPPTSADPAAAPDHEAATGEFARRAESGAVTARDTVNAMVEAGLLDLVMAPRGRRRARADRGWPVSPGDDQNCARTRSGRGADRAPGL